MHAAFSADGKSVVFSSERGGLLDETPLISVFCPQPYGDLFSIQLSDKTVTQITKSKWENSLPDWVEETRLLF
jgi:Tol biopolymer transport system component